MRRPLVPHHRLVQQLCRLCPAGFRDQAPFGGNLLRLKPIVILGGADARLNIATMLGDAGGGVPNMVLQILDMRLGRLVELLLRGGGGLLHLLRNFVAGGGHLIQRGALGGAVGPQLVKTRGIDNLFELFGGDPGGLPGIRKHRLMHRKCLGGRPIGKTHQGGVSLFPIRHRRGKRLARRGHRGLRLSQGNVNLYGFGVKRRIQLIQAQLPQKHIVLGGEQLQCGLRLGVGGPGRPGLSEGRKPMLGNEISQVRLRLGHRIVGFGVPGARGDGDGDVPDGQGGGVGDHMFEFRVRGLPVEGEFRGRRRPHRELGGPQLVGVPGQAHRGFGRLVLGDGRRGHLGDGNQCAALGGNIVEGAAQFFQLSSPLLAGCRVAGGGGCPHRVVGLLFRGHGCGTRGGERCAALVLRLGGLAQVNQGGFEPFDALPAGPFAFHKL